MSSKYTCGICGKEFTPRIRTERYCSAECREQAMLKIKRESSRRSRAKNKVTHSLVCKICGSHFNSTRINSAFCSLECKKEDKRIRRKKRDDRLRELGIRKKRDKAKYKKIKEPIIKPCDCKRKKAPETDLNVNKVIAYLRLPAEKRREHFDKLTKKEKDYAKKLFLQDGYSC